jgi:hypothetical protein
MNNSTTKSDDKKPVVFKKPGSPFSNDPYNNRSGKGGHHSGPVGGTSQKMKSIVPQVKKGGSGGDR